MAPGPNAADMAMLNSEHDASPERFDNFDPNGYFRDEYHRMHPDQREALHRQVTEGGPDSSAESIEEPEEREEVEEPEIDRIPTATDINRPTLRSRSSTATHRINTLERHSTALSRIETHRLQHEVTVGSRVSRRTTGKSDRPLPNFGAGKPYPAPLPDKEEYVVEFDGPHDPLHPQNWPMKKKLVIAGVLAFDALCATFGSSVFSAATTKVAGEFHVGREVGTLGTSLFVLGYAFGPIIWGPFSELKGRRPPIIVGTLGFAIFNIAVAVSKDIQQVIICRFFAGLFGSAPLAVVAAVYADMFDNRYRGIAVAVFSATVFCGPLFAPFIGGFITTSYLGWRWTEYLTAIMGFGALILVVFFQKETYPPVILVDKASELRRRTKNWGIHAKQEEIEVNLVELVQKNVSRPFRILFTEPIVFAISLYMAFLYGLLYLFLTAYALVFQGVYGMSPGVAGLPYFGLVIGELLAFTVTVLMNPWYVRKLEANQNVPVPEWRLPLVMIGGILFAAGLFWFGWTGFTKDIPWIVPTLSGLFTGFGLFSVFLSLLNYIIDAYLMFAASAIAGNTFLRSIFGAVFPLFATYMYEGIGINYGNTLIGCVAAVLTPLPFIFFFMGKRIRALSKLAPAPDLELDKKRDEESRGVSGTSDDSNDGEDEKKK